MQAYEIFIIFCPQTNFSFWFVQQPSLVRDPLFTFVNVLGVCVGEGS